MKVVRNKQEKMAQANSEVTFAEATSIKQLSSHTYEANLRDDWSIGSVPHGGFVTSCFLAVTAKHFGTTLASQKQPHTICLRLEFLKRTETGPALFTVKDAKIGRQTSVIHVSLCQGPNNTREEVVGYITNSNMATEEGMTLDTEFSLYPAPIPVNLSQLREDKDILWGHLKNLPFPKFRRATNKIKMHFPRAGQTSRNFADEWICFTNGERFTNASLGFVCDMFPMVAESFRSENPYSLSPKKLEDKAKKSEITAAIWYPTLNLNIEMKKSLPEEGVEWLYVRAAAKQIKNGRMDLDVTVLDESGDIVALSYHTTLALSASRNTSKRSHDTSRI